MATPMGDSPTLWHCESCGTTIPDDHPYTWCSSCGTSLPSAVTAHLGNVYTGFTRKADAPRRLNRARG
jgi:hypothetical protein